MGSPTNRLRCSQLVWLLNVCFPAPGPTGWVQLHCPSPQMSAAEHGLLPVAGGLAGRAGLGLNRAPDCPHNHTPACVPFTNAQWMVPLRCASNVLLLLEMFLLSLFIYIINNVKPVTVVNCTNDSNFQLSIAAWNHFTAHPYLWQGYISPHLELFMGLVLANRMLVNVIQAEVWKTVLMWLLSLETLPPLWEEQAHKEMRDTGSRAESAQLGPN